MMKLNLFSAKSERQTGEKMNSKQQKDTVINHIKTEIDMLMAMNNPEEMIKHKNYIEMTLLLFVKFEIFNWDQAELFGKELSATSEHALAYIEPMKKGHRNLSVRWSCPPQHIYIGRRYRWFD